MMRVWVFALTISAASTLFGADEQRLALSLKAQSEFNRVELAAVPDLRATTACAQTQAALLSVSPPEELPLLHYRKGFCTLAGALVTHNSSEFTVAAAEFDSAIQGWPARAAANGKNKPVEPVPSGLRILASIARLEAGADDPGVNRAQQEIAAATSPAACTSNLMSSAFCGALVQVGRLWLGWMALRRDNLPEATQAFSGTAGTGWPEWVSGRQAFQDGKYSSAAADYRTAVELAQRVSTPSITDSLAPKPDVPAELTELGGAQLLANQLPASLTTLNQAVKADSTNARALFLRARAEELSNQLDKAMTDYNLASRTAFANAKDLASGEAHLYRGILLYRRKDLSQAEDEFSSALNFEIAGGLRADAVAWRHMTAVASGSCAASRAQLEQALPKTSPYFPKDEARTLMSACPATLSAVEGPANSIK